jgi:MFS family permease
MSASTPAISLRRPQEMNPRRLFIASCVALVTTAMVFSIRSDILDALGSDFHLNKEQLGLLLSPAFWGFTVSIMLGGALVDFFGMRRLLLLSSAGYFISVLAIIFAPRPSAAVSPFYTDPGFLTLYAGMLILGLSQGLVEGVINPLCATIYANDKTRRFNMLHAWWPGGLIIGGLLAFAVTKVLELDVHPSAAMATLGWKIKMSLVLLAAGTFAVMTLGQSFPPTERVAAGVSNRDMIQAIFKPMFLVWFALMWLTASTELGPDQWIGSVITNLTGMQGILVLVYTSGVVFLLRFFGGGLAHRLSPLRLLTIAAVLACVGLLGLSVAKSMLGLFSAATAFGAGTSYFWPVMLGVTSERFPQTGPAGLAIMGGTGQLAAAFILPMMGHWYDLSGPAAAFQFVAVLPVVLTVAFTILFLRYRAIGGYKPLVLNSGNWSK